MVDVAALLDERPGERGQRREACVERRPAAAYRIDVCGVYAFR
jgi:hypothetical protein